MAVMHAQTLGLTGVVLTGGEDLARYGGQALHRDAAERALLDWAIEDHRPILGVCRGMQLLLDTFGVGLEPVVGHVATEHELSLADGSVRTVNSYHHWGARRLSAPLVATAWAGEIVEAVRHETLPLHGIMWHPERLTTFANEDVEMIANLFDGRA